MSAPFLVRREIMGSERSPKEKKRSRARSEDSSSSDCMFFFSSMYILFLPFPEKIHQFASLVSLVLGFQSL